MSVSRRCHVCSGSGWIITKVEGVIPTDGEPCDACNGTGTFTPNKPERGKSRRMVTLRLSIAEDIAIKTHAALANMSINEWLRRVALGNLPNGYEAKHVETKQTKPHQTESSGSETQVSTNAPRGWDHGGD